MSTDELMTADVFPADVRRCEAMAFGWRNIFAIEGGGGGGGGYSHLLENDTKSESTESESERESVCLGSGRL